MIKPHRVYCENYSHANIYIYKILLMNSVYFMFGVWYGVRLHSVKCR